MMSTGVGARDARGGRHLARAGAVARAWPPGEVGYLITGVKDVRQARVGDTVTSAARPATEPLRRLRPSPADGVLRPVPGGRRRLPGPARRAGQAAAERRRAGVRAGDERRARVRLPLRVPRPAAHGDRPRAAGARVRPVADLHRAERRLPRRHGHRQGAPGDQPERLPRRTPDRREQGQDRPGSSSRWCGRRCISPGRVHRHDHGAVPGPGAAPCSAWTTCPRTGWRSATRCRSPRSSSTSSTSSSRGPAATRRWTTSPTASRRPTWSRSTSCCRASRWTRSARSCTPTRPASTAWP